MRHSLILSVASCALLFATSAQANGINPDPNDSRSLQVPSFGNDMHHGTQNFRGEATLGMPSQGIGINHSFGGGTGSAGSPAIRQPASGAPAPARPAPAPLVAAPAPAVSEPMPSTHNFRGEATLPTTDNRAVLGATTQGVAPARGAATTGATITAPASPAISPVNAPLPAVVQNPSAYGTIGGTRGQAGASAALPNTTSGTASGQPEATTNAPVISQTLHRMSLQPMAPANAAAMMQVRTQAAKSERKARFDAWEQEQVQKERAAKSLFRQ